METGTTTSARYRRFAELEARGYSPLYDDWCIGISDDAELLALLDTLPPARRQPVLFLGAARFVGVPLDGFATFRSFVVARWPMIRQVMLANEESNTTVPETCRVLGISKSSYYAALRVAQIQGLLVAVR